MVGQVKLNGSDRDEAVTHCVLIGIVAAQPVDSAAANPVMLAAPGVKGLLDGVLINPAALSSEAYESSLAGQGTGESRLPFWVR